MSIGARAAPLDPAGCGGPAVHVAFAGDNRTTVDAFYHAALAAGARGNGAPGLRPQHGEGYYAGFVRDPDGNRLEAVTFLKADS